MEKQQSAEAPARPRNRPTWSSPRFWLVIGLGLYCTGLLWQWIHSKWGVVQHKHDREREGTTTAFSWDSVDTKPYLEYTPCYGGGFQCARLELPMDYWNGTTNATVSLAVVRKPAVVPVTHPQYGGAILLNPGGPGGSGVLLTVGAGDQFSQILDSEDGKYFDLIGFDPRGVAMSLPAVRCSDDISWNSAWDLRLTSEGLFSTSDAAFGRVWSMFLASGQSCSLPRSDGEPDIKQYVSTASVARDMLEIAEKHGDWRQKEATRLLSGESPCHHRNFAYDPQSAIEIPEHLKYHVGKEKIQYWGFSYGTVLGNTFAAMFPDRIHRLVVDGVVDIDDYKKALWFDNLVDTEQDHGLFYFHCARVGFPRCPLANENGTTTAENVRERVQKVFQSLYHNPLPIVGPRPDVITYSDLRGLMFVALYSPIQTFPLVAGVMAGIEQGDGKFLAELLGPTHLCHCSCDFNAQFFENYEKEQSRTTGLTGADAQTAIMCTDGDPQSGVTKDDFAEHLRNLTDLSPTFGDVWGTLRLQCIHFSIRAPSRFTGPWEGKTSHPILEVGNTADPVTPGRYAKKMAKGFKGAVALLQDSPGHCSISAPSRCTQGYIRQYFQTGELPPEDTICPVDVQPFGNDDAAQLSSIEKLAISKATERSERIMEAIHLAGGGFVPLSSQTKLLQLLE